MTDLYSPEAEHLRVMGVPTELEKAIGQAWNVVIPTDVTDEEYWRLSIAKDERLVELYTQLHDALTCVSLMTKLVLDARNGRRDQIREARRVLREIEEGKTQVDAPLAQKRGMS